MVSGTDANLLHFVQPRVLSTFNDTRPRTERQLRRNVSSRNGQSPSHDESEAAGTGSRRLAKRKPTPAIGNDGPARKDDSYLRPP